MIALKILSAGVLIYLSWALIHHKKNKSLTAEVFLEYLLTAALVMVILIGALM